MYIHVYHFIHVCYVSASTCGHVWVVCMVVHI